MIEQISQIKLDFLTKITQAQTLQELDALYLTLFGKNGVITLIPKDFPKMEKSQLAVIVPAFSQLKNDLSVAIHTRRDEVREAGYAELAKESVDLNTPITLPTRIGYLHPITRFEQEIADIFKKLHFQQFDAPHIDTDFLNSSSSPIASSLRAASVKLVPLGCKRGSV